MQKVKEWILSHPYEEKRKSDEFAGVYVHSGSPFKLENHQAIFHGFYVFSRYHYPVYLFTDVSSITKDLYQLLKLFSDIRVITIPRLSSSFLYNEWMFNTCFNLIPEKYENLLTFQEDCVTLSSGWEDYVIGNKFDYVGAPFRSRIDIFSKIGQLKRTKNGNGGMSYRKRSKMIEITNLVNKYGGQHDFFKGIMINDKMMQNNSWLCEDILFVSVGYHFGILNPVTLHQCAKFSLEPLPSKFVFDTSHTHRPFFGHKVDN